MDGSPLTRAPGGVDVRCWVVPGSSRPGLDGLHGGAVRVRVGSPPEGGRANDEAASRVAAACGGRRGEVIRGAKGRSKVVRVEGVGVTAAAAALRAAGLPLEGKRPTDREERGPC
jgi:uncharacterized protein YggU (UPF0235/DUF167 family)